MGPLGGDECLMRSWKWGCHDGIHALMRMPTPEAAFLPAPTKRSCEDTAAWWSWASTRAQPCWLLDLTVTKCVSVVSATQSVVLLQQPMLTKTRMYCGSCRQKRRKHHGVANSWQFWRACLPVHGIPHLAPTQSMSVSTECLWVACCWPGY